MFEYLVTLQFDCQPGLLRKMTRMELHESLYLDRDISWLSFNHRVLQEAQNPATPLYERIKFLAIFSSNLDEFYRVRVASLRSFRQLKKATRKALEVKPRRQLKQIRAIVEAQQLEFGRIFKLEILPALEREGIFLLEEQDFSVEQTLFAENFFKEKIQPAIDIIWLSDKTPPPFLKNKAIYLFIRFPGSEDLALMEIPSAAVQRFIILPPADGQRLAVAFLDDVIRLNLGQILHRPIEGAFAVKLSRDAEMYIEDEYSGDLVAKIRKGLENRHIGLPTRFLYDSSAPATLVQKIKNLLGLNKNDMIPGARYHNFNDFFAFPCPEDRPHLHDAPQPPLPHPEMERANSILQLMEREDQVLHFPYHKYAYVLRLLDEAASTPSVKSIRITLYRLATPSLIITSLLKACNHQKEVVVFIEAKARFDEASNLEAGEMLTRAGAKVYYSYPGIKVHAKLLLIESDRKGTPFYYGYLSTGNFNEKTAGIYADHALFTCDPRLTRDMVRVFNLLERKIIKPDTKHLFVAPFDLRERFYQLIDKEIERAKSGLEGIIIAKLNSLEDKAMIDKLYQAGQAGVRIQLIVRGIFCLKTGIEGLSPNIQATSIVERYLEHARVFIFGGAGQEKIFLASADWMNRNLDHRIEVAIPVYNPRIQAQIRRIVDIQLKDTCKARILDERLENRFRPQEPGLKSPQTLIYQLTRDGM